MSEEEKSFFGIEEDSPIANTKFENPMYNKASMGIGGKMLC